MGEIDSNATPPSVQENINTVIKMEESALQKRTPADRISDVIASFVGSIPFVMLHVVWFGVWVGLNVTFIKFDPYPFSLLCMLVSLEGVLLSTFVLIKQNRMSERADHRNHLDLQVNMLAEKEVTKVLQLQRLICRKLDIHEGDTDEEVAELSNITAIDNLSRQLMENSSKGKQIANTQLL